MHHTDLSDEELVSQLASLCLEGRRLVARVIVHLIAVEDRRLHVNAACDSMWSLCTQRLGMSHGETSRRLNAVRLVRRFPSLIGRIERGDIHLSSLKILGRHLDESNLETLLDGAKGKSKLEVQELVARHFPRPDAPETVVEQPAAPTQASLVASPAASPPIAPRAPVAHEEPLSATTYLVQMTMSREGWDDLNRVRALISHRVRNGKTVDVVEAALKMALAQLEKEVLGKTSQPQSTRRPSKPGHIAQATRREVFERDREQCTFVDERGNRCQSRTRLELDHIVPRAHGGSDEASNLRVACRSHNKHYAEEIFGKDFVAEKIHCRRRQSERLREQAGVEERVSRLSPATVTSAPSTPGETIELASKGLANMGFAKLDVKRAMDGICARHAGEVMPVEALLREAISALT